MARLLVRRRTHDTPPVLSRGDVVDVKPDGFDWQHEGCSLGWKWHRDGEDWDDFVVLDCPRLTVDEGVFLQAVAAPPARGEFDAGRPRFMMALDLDRLPDDLTTWDLPAMVRCLVRKPPYVGHATFGLPATRFGS